VPREIDLGHAAFANQALESVLADEAGIAHFTAQTLHIDCGPQHRGERERKQAEDDREGEIEVVEGGIGFGRAHFDGDAEVVLREPAPRAH
jgi:hypothetical protein